MQLYNIHKHIHIKSHCEHCTAPGTHLDMELYMLAGGTAFILSICVPYCMTSLWDCNISERGIPKALFFPLVFQKRLKEHEKKAL